jgi:hypothetical protein
MMMMMYLTVGCKYPREPQDKKRRRKTKTTTNNKTKDEGKKSAFDKRGRRTN